MKRLAGIIVVSLAACSNSGTRADRLAFLDTVVAKCHLPPSTFKLIGTAQLQIQPSSDAKFQNFDCALNELKKSPFPMKMGFVGNEVSEPEKK